MEITQKPMILAVDDEPANLEMLNGFLEDLYDMRLANSGKAALAFLEKQIPDLILLDVLMMGMDGYAVCRALKANPDTAEIPVIFLTAKTDAQDEEAGLNIGAVDYIQKPIQPIILRARVNTHIKLAKATRFLESQNHLLEHLVEERTKEVSSMQVATIIALASLAETRDQDTGNHIKRTQNYVGILATELSKLEAYSDELTPDVIRYIYASAPLHDIGKVGIPDSILLKSGELTSAEFTVMQQHTRIGRKTLESVERYLGKETDFLQYAKQITYSHHEHFDGTGYPEGLAGKEIPLSARIMALADVYDALISRRIYKPPYDHEVAVVEIMKGCGAQFDPDIANCFLKNGESFRKIALEFEDVS